MRRMKDSNLSNVDNCRKPRSIFPVSSKGIDVADRLLNTWTWRILLIFAFVAYTKHFFGVRMECLLLTHDWVGMNDSVRLYMNEVCFEASGKVKSANAHVIGLTHIYDLKMYYGNNSLENPEITATPIGMVYTHWAPFGLICAVLLCTMPTVFWSIARDCSRFPWKSSMANTILARNACSTVERKLILEGAAQHLIKARSSMRANGSRNPITRITAPICIIFMIFKVLNILLVAAAVVIMGQFILTKTWFFRNFPGFTARLVASPFSNPSSPNDRTSGDIFETVFAKFSICNIPNVEVFPPKTMTALCVNPLNSMMEKVVFFIWCWSIFLLCVLCMNAICWIYSARSTCRARLFTDLLICSDERLCVVNQHRSIERFIKVLGADTWLLLQFVREDGGKMVAMQLVKQLWEQFLIFEGIRNRKVSIISAITMCSAETIPADCFFAALPIVPGVLADNDLFETSPPPHSDSYITDYGKKIISFNF